MKPSLDSHRFGKGDLAIIGTTLLWGFGVVVVKSAIGETPETFRTFVFNGLRLPLVSLLLFAALRLRGVPLTIHRKHLPRVVAVAFFGIFLNTVTAISGLNLSTASNMGIITSSSPLLILLVSFVTGIERPTPKLAIGIIVGMSGIFLLNYRQGEFVVHIGDFLILLSCLCFAIYAVFSKKIVAHYSAMVTAAWMFFFAGVFQLPLLFYYMRFQTWNTITPVNWLNFIIAAIGSYFAANVLFFYAIRRIGTVRVGVYLNLQPVFSLVGAYFMLGETITTMKLAGLMIILTGIWITKIPMRANKIFAKIEG